MKKSWIACIICFVVLLVLTVLGCAGLSFAQSLPSALLEYVDLLVFMVDSFVLGVIIAVVLGVYSIYLLYVNKRTAKCKWLVGFLPCCGVLAVSAVYCFWPTGIPISVLTAVASRLSLLNVAVLLFLPELALSLILLRKK